MKREHRWAIGLLLLACLPLAACKQESTVAQAAAEESGPAEVVHGEGAQPSQVTLTAEAAKRLDIQTDTIREATIDGKVVRIIPYDAVLYDPEGDTWTYTNPEGRTYVRFHVTIDRIVDGHAVLIEGPAAGVPVVTVGSTELFGSESEFEEE